MRKSQLLRRYLSSFFPSNPNSTPAISESLEVRQHLSIAEPNNSFATAFTPSNNIYLETSYTSTDSVSAADPDDYYKFYSLYGSSSLYAPLYGLSADADLYVYDANFNLLGSSTKGGNLSDLVNATIPANQYFYVRVHNVGSGSTNYNLLLLNDYAGNSTGTARNQGTSWGQTNDKYSAFGQLFINDYMDFRDNTDVFKFNMEAPGTISLRRLATQDPGGGALVTNLQLLNSGGTVIANGSSGGGGLNLDRFTLNTGTYYVRLQQSAGSGNYQLRIVSDYAGDTAATARNLGDITNSVREDYDMVGGPFGLPTYEDALDLYKIKLSKATPLDIQMSLTNGLTPPTFDADLYIAKDTNGNGFIESGEILKTSALAGTDKIHYDSLGAGTYFVGVKQHGAYTNYQLSIDSDIDFPIGSSSPNKDMSFAQNLGSLTGMVNFDGGFGISSGDISDFYKFTLATSTKVRVGAFNNPAWSRNNVNPFASIVKDINNNFIRDNNETVAQGSGGFITTLPAGTYYLALGGSGGTTAYYGSITPDAAGNTLPTARAMAAVPASPGTTQSFNDYIEQAFDSSSDSEDFYSFTLPSTLAVALKTTGVSGEDLSLSLIKDTNNNGKMDAGEFLAVSDVLNSPTESITKTLAAGKYFVRVHGVNGGTNYNLSAAFGAGAPVADPDDTISKISGAADHNLSTGSVVNFSLTPNKDVDLFKFVATAGKTIKIDLDSRNGSTLDTYLRIFKSDGTQLASNDNGAASGETLAKFSYLSYTFTTAGTYYIGVSLAPNKTYNISTGNGDVSGGTTGDYKMTIS